MLKVVAPERLTAVMRTATYSWSGRSGVVLMVKTLVSWTPRLFQLLTLSPTLTSMASLVLEPQPPSMAAAPRAAAEAPVQSAETTYPVEADGEIHELTLDELIEAAAQGLSRHNAYVRRNRAANALPNGQIYAAFVEEYPDVRPEDIPQQVWEWAQQEGSLVSAYRKWEIAELRDELAALEMNRRNRRAAVGTAQTDGEPAGIDPVTLALLGR